MLDILIKNGIIIDGSGKESFVGDIGIKDDKIEFVSPANEAKNHEAKEYIDASNLHVCPGFVDIHTHTDMAAPIDGRAISQIRQGVTTCIGGLCGFSLAPIQKPEALLVNASYGVEPTWTDFSSYLEAMDGFNLGLNLGSLVGHGTLRIRVMSDPIGQASQEEIEKMQEVLDDCMKAGAFGLSTGLEYNPGKASNQTELCELCKVVKKHEGLHAVHTRNRDIFYLSALAENIDITKTTGVHLHISHLNPKFGRHQDCMSDLLALIRRTNEQGYDVSVDLMPSQWNHTSTMALMPLWAQNLPKEELQALLKSADGRKKLKENPSPIWQLAHQDKWDKIYHFGGKVTKHMQGKSIAEIAKEQNISGWDALCDILAQEVDDYASSMLASEGFSLEDISLALQEPFSSVVSDGVGLTLDGPLEKAVFSRNTYDWVPVFFDNFVFNEKPLLSLEKAVEKISSIPAKQAGIVNRGLLKKGHYADIAIINMKELKSTTSLQEPLSYAEGIERVFVNGKQSYQKGDRDILCHGKALRFNQV